MATKRSGFTLIELMAVVLLIGLMLGGVTANLGRVLPGAVSESAARQLIGDIDLARSSAIANGRSYIMVLDLDQQEYRLLPPYDEDGRIARNQEERNPLSRKSLPAGIRLDAVLGPDGGRIEQGIHQLVFPPDGVMLDIVLFLINEVDAYYDSTVHIGGLTGRSEIVEGHQELRSINENDF